MIKPREATAKPGDASEATDGKKTGGKKRDASGSPRQMAPIDWTKPPFMVAYVLVALVITVFVVKAIFFSGPSGPPLTRFTGTVIMEGKPVAGADVTFHPVSKQGATAFARTDRMGHFDMKTGGTGKGVMIDDYRVTITKLAWEEKPMSPVDAKKFTSKEGKAPPPPKQSSSLPEIYASVQTTPLGASVKDRRPVRKNFDLKK